MNLVELLNDTITAKITDMHICLPAKIVSYDYTLRKAIVQPAITQRYNDDSVVELPLIYNVPVVQPASGGAFIHLPVKENDNVLLVFSEKSLEEWLVNGEVSTPDDPRQNNLTDAIAIIGLSPFVASGVANNEDVIISYSGSTINIKPDGVIDVEAETINLLADNVNVSGKLTAANIEATNEIKSATANIGGKDFATHIHSGVQSGGSNTGVVV